MIVKHVLPAKSDRRLQAALGVARIDELTPHEGLPGPLKSTKGLEPIRNSRFQMISGPGA